MTALLIFPRSTTAALLCIPATEAFMAHFEGCRVVGVLSAQGADLFRFDERFHGIAVRPEIPWLGWQEMGRFVRQLNDEYAPFEWVVNFDSSLSSLRLARKLHTEHRATLAPKRWFWPFGWQHRVAPNPDEHLCMDGLRLIESLTQKSVQPSPPSLTPTQPQEPTKIGICATGAVGSRYDWGMHRWAECALRLSDKGPVRLFAEPDALAALDRMESVLSYNGVRTHESFGHERSLQALLGALGSLKLMVGGEGLLTQMAMALGVPTVIIYGPGDARRNGPFHNLNAEAISRPVACRPCARCRDAEHICLNSITPDEVCQAAQRLLLRVPLNKRPLDEIAKGVA